MKSHKLGKQANVLQTFKVTMGYIICFLLNTAHMLTSTANDITSKRETISFHREG